MGQVETGAGAGLVPAVSGPGGFPGGVTGPAMEGRF